MNDDLALKEDLDPHISISSIEDIINSVLSLYKNDIKNIPCAIEFENIHFSPKTGEFTAGKMSIGMNIILNKD
jgi:hypothetical protein